MKSEQQKLAEKIDAMLSGELFTDDMSEAEKIKVSEEITHECQQRKLIDK